MKLCWFIGLLLAVPVAAQPGPKPGNAPPAIIHSVRPLAEANGPMIEIISSQPLVPSISKLENPPRLVIDLPNARLTGHEKRLELRGSEINGVRLSQFQQNPAVARIVVDLSRPVTYSWDAAGNRLLVRIHAAEEPAKPATVPAITRETLPVSGFSGAVMLAGSRVGNGSAVTAGEDSAVLRLGRGGEVLVCPKTTVSVTTSQNGRSLMLGMDTGSLETHYALQAEADSILTPDFRILLAGPGEFHFGVRADSRGNTCIQSLPGNTAGVIVSELLGDGTYQVKAAQQVMFHNGKLGSPDTVVPMNCGCPPSTQPVVLAAEKAEVKGTLPGSETRPLPASKPNDVHVQVDVPMVFRGSEPPPPPVEEARLLPLSGRMPGAFVPVATPAKPARHGFFSKLRGFFSAIFG